LLGLTYNDSKASESALKQALAHARECKVSHVTIFAHACWAWMLTMQGRLHEAVSACQEAIQLAQSASSHQPLPTLSHVFSTLSFVLCEWNDLEGALYYSKEAVSLARQWEQADALHFALDNLGNALYASGDIEGAFIIHNQAWQVARNTSRWFEEITISQEVEWYLAQGNLETALETLRRAQIQIDEPSSVSFHAYKSHLMPLTIIQILIAQKQYSKALKFTQHYLGEMENRKFGYFIIRLLTWQALEYYGLRQQEQAMASLERALTLAAPEGYVRTFVKQQPGLINLLRHAHTARIMPEYIEKLLATSEQEVKSQSIELVTTRGLFEPLTEREIEVLRQLAQGCTDKKIAENLVIARETVHKHLKNIYGKLDVHSRTEAIVRAYDLKLL
jgi:LuxR family maltose regulon positive regulatory protein